jgi:hypothetical protein
MDQGDEEFVGAVADRCGFAADDVRAAHDLLNLRQGELHLRLSQLAIFAKTFGVDIRNLAEFIARTGGGIEPYTNKSHMTSEESERVREAIKARATPGNWADAILSLLDEIELLKNQR